MAELRDYVIVSINGKRYHVDKLGAFMTLAVFLRTKHNLPGTKIVCAEGDCGACTVLYRRESGSFYPINACIAFVAQLDGAEILTVESLKENGELSSVQKAMVDHHSSQCGYCTPGFAMAMTAIFEDTREDLTEQKIKNRLTGNLCRCTGYQPLIEAALAVDAAHVTPQHRRYFFQDLLSTEEAKLPIHIKSDDGELFAPRNLVEASQFKKSRRHSRVLAGATDSAVPINKGRANFPSMLSLHLVENLDEINCDNDRVTVGARVTIEKLRRYTKNIVPEFSRFLNLFASPQIKNMASLVGNVANGSPIGDTLPFLLVADGRVHVFGEEGKREIEMVDLYEDYKKLSLRPDEIITHISFACKDDYFLSLKKVSMRKDLDISAVNAAFMMKMSHDKTVSELRLAFGGIAKTVLRISTVEKFLCHKKLADDVIDAAMELLQKEIAPQSDLRGSAHYRRVVVDGLLREFLNLARMS